MYSPNRICYHCSFFSEKSNIPITTKHCIFPYNISHYLTGLTLKTGLVSLQNTQLQSTFALVYVQSLDTRKITGCVTNIAVSFLELLIPGVYRLSDLIRYSQKCLASLLKILIIVIKNYVHFEAL